MFKIIENFITEDEWYQIIKIINNSQWIYNNSSNPATPDTTIFWNIILKDKILEDKILKKIEKYVDKKFEVIQVKVNGQTYGLDGDWHRDGDDESMYTLLIYLSPINAFNLKEIGGYTKFNINNMILDVEPYQRRAVFFNAKIEHKGLAPLTKNMLRVSIAFKLKEV